MVETTALITLDGKAHLYLLTRSVEAVFIRLILMSSIQNSQTSLFRGWITRISLPLCQRLRNNIIVKSKIAYSALNFTEMAHSIFQILYKCFINVVHARFNLLLQSARYPGAFVNEFNT